MILTAMGKGGGGGALYPDFVGRRALFVGSGTGPVSSSATIATADQITLALPSYYIDAVLDGASTDGTTYLQAWASGPGPRATWSVFYYSMSGSPVGPLSGSNLSTKTFVVSAIVGQF